MSRRGRIAQDQFTRALLDAAARGERIPCGDDSISYLFLSGDPAERQLGMRACHGCVVFDPCGEAALANREVFSVRAGRDFTKSPGRTA
jgi:hypothetical protein